MTTRRELARRVAELADIHDLTEVDSVHQRRRDVRSRLAMMSANLRDAPETLPSPAALRAGREIRVAEVRAVERGLRGLIDEDGASDGVLLGAFSRWRRAQLLASLDTAGAIEQILADHVVHEAQRIADGAHIRDDCASD